MRAFAPLREILLKLASGDFQTGTETFPRERREDISTDPNFSLAVAGRVCQCRVLGKARWTGTRTSQDRIVVGGNGG